MKKVKFFCLVFAFVFVVICFRSSLEKALAVENENSRKPTYSAIISVWQVDMVEGGLSSRTSLLKRVGSRFENKNKTVKIAVEQVGYEGAIKKISNGILPDVISFSNGLDQIFPYAVPIQKNSSLGVSLGKALCQPWAVGGYVLISLNGGFNKPNLYISQNTYTLPQIAYYYFNVEYPNVTVLSPLNAYSVFLADKNAVLLGTQRDLFRLKSRKTECEYKVNTQFSDIIQYVAVTARQKQKQQIAKEFVQMVTSLSQADLDNVGMISPYLTYGNDTGVLKNFVGFSVKSTVSVYTSSQKIVECQQNLVAEGLNRQEKSNIIKNIVQ